MIRQAISKSLSISRFKEENAEFSSKRLVRFGLEICES